MEVAEAPCPGVSDPPVPETPAPFNCPLLLPHTTHTSKHDLLTPFLTHMLSLIAALLAVGWDLPLYPFYEQLTNSKVSLIFFLSQELFRNVFFICLFPKIYVHKLSYILYVQNVPKEMSDFIVHILI